MERLKLPSTLRFPNLDEIPKSEELIARIREGQNANIVQGFKFYMNNEIQLPFKFYAEINIDNHKLWSLFKTFADHLPDEVSFIFNLEDEKPIYTKYENKEEILKQLDKFERELTQDCFIEYGVIHQNDTMLEEIFVDKTKYLKYWGSDENWFRGLMKSYLLNEEPELNFMDEFPKVREALRSADGGVVATPDLIKKFNAIFQIAGI